MPDLLLDIGQTSTRARLMQGDVITAALEDLPGLVTGGDVCLLIQSSVLSAARAFDAARIDRVAAGCSGLFGSAPDIDALGKALRAAHGTTTLRVADDGVTAFLGALAGSRGAMVAAGTGIVALAHGPSGAARADGVGAMIGDNGSGWWIGRAGIISALSAADGRPNGSQRLLDAATRRYGLVNAIPMVIATSGTPIATTAAFAIDVAEAARDGDPTAREIWHQAAGFIADAIIAVADRAGLPDDLQWCTLGRVALSIDLLEPTLSQRITARFPSARASEPIGSVMEGIHHLLQLETLRDFRLMASEYRH